MSALSEPEHQRLKRARRERALTRAEAAHERAVTAAEAAEASPTARVATARRQVQRVSEHAAALHLSAAELQQLHLEEEEKEYGVAPP